MPARNSALALPREQPSETQAQFPKIPDKIYFTISEVSKLCDVKDHTLRYWEEEFAEFLQIKRWHGRRRYERTHILVLRRIRVLVHDRGFTISGARKELERSLESRAVRREESEPDTSLVDELRELRSLIDVARDSLKSTSL